MESIYSYLDYRKYLKNWLAEQRKLADRITLTRLAENIGVQQSYLSQVLSGQRELSLDQGYLLAEFLSFDEDQSHYLNLMIEFSRTAINRRKKDLKTKLLDIRKSKQNVESHISSPSLDLQQQEFHEFYKDPVNAIVHTALTVPDFRNDLSKMAEATGVSLQKINSVIENLVRLKLVRPAGKAFEPLQPDFHFSRSSWFYPYWGRLTRSLAESRQLIIPRDNSYEFNVFFSSDDEARAKIKEEFFDFIGKVKKISMSHEPSDLLFLSFDCFKWNQ